MNNLFDEYSSTIRKAGQLLKIISCKHSIFQPMAPHTSHPPERVPTDFWISLGLCAGRGCSSKQPEDFTMAVVSILPSQLTLQSSLSLPVFSGTDPPGCTELSKQGSADTSPWHQGIEQFCQWKERMQVQMCVTPSAVTASAPGSFCAAVLLSWMSLTQGGTHESNLWSRGAASHTAGPEQRHNRGGTSCTSQALIPFSRHKPLSRPHNYVIFSVSARLLVLPLQASSQHVAQ